MLALEKSIAHKERGNGLVELVVVMPVLLLLMFGSIDIGIALNNYVSLNRVVYEGLRYASVMPNLESGEFVTNDSVPTVQNNLRLRLFDTLERLDIDRQTVSLTTALYKSDNPDTLGRERVIKIALRVPHQGLFPFWNNITSLTAEASGPYLIPDES